MLMGIILVRSTCCFCPQFDAVVVVMLVLELPALDTEVIIFIRFCYKLLLKDVRVHAPIT